MDALPQQTLIVATSQVGIREIGGNNRGPEVETYLAFCGRAPGDPWCASFVSWCIDQAATQLGVTYTFRKSARAMGLLEKNPGLIIDTPDFGAIFVIDHGQGLGHTGLVVAVNNDGTLATIEGNTTVKGARDSTSGDGVYARMRRAAEVTGGYLRIA